MKRGKPRKNRAAWCDEAKTGRKIRYRSLKDAKIARASVLEHNDIYIRIYKCKKCHGYHLTSKKPLTTNSTVWRDTETDKTSYNNKRDNHEEGDMKHD